MASQTGYLTLTGGTDYCASKAAAISIYEGLHSEMKHYYKAPAVRVSCISPTHVQTSLFKGIDNPPGMASITPQSLAETIEGVLKSGRAQNLLVHARAESKRRRDRFKTVAGKQAPAHPATATGAPARVRTAVVDSGRWWR